MLSRSVVSDSATQWTAAQQATLSMGFSRQECWRALPFPPPEDLPDPGIEPSTPTSRALACGFFTTVIPGKRDLGSYGWKAQILYIYLFFWCLRIEVQSQSQRSWVNIYPGEKYKDFGRLWSEETNHHWVSILFSQKATGIICFMDSHPEAAGKCIFRFCGHTHYCTEPVVGRTSCLIESHEFFPF